MNFKAVLGLGNSGAKYQNTYHNVGHLMVDFLSKKNILPSNVIIAKNDGYMNEAGNSAINLLKKAKIKPENLLVVHDDSDIAIGNYKLSVNRGSAGHKGIDDIIKKIGSKNFWRLRIGVRPADNAELCGFKRGLTQNFSAKSAYSQRQSAYRMKAGKFVLKKIKKEHRDALEKVFEEAAAKLIN